MTTLVGRYIKETIDRVEKAKYSDNTLLLSMYEIKSYKSGYYIIENLRKTRANSDYFDRTGRYYLISENNIKIRNDAFFIDEKNIIPGTSFCHSHMYYQRCLTKY